jgi:hypothetical protein
MKSLLPLTFFIFLFSCNATKFVKEPPFKIVDAKYQYWYGGREGVKGISVKIMLKDIADSVTFEHIYFKNKKLNASLTKVKNLKLLSANINTGSRVPGLQMHQDPKKEYGNTLPKSQKDFPFKLQGNEAVISYKKNNKTYFYKVILKKDKDLYMP